ncbi:hypothetical protein IQ278_22380 [Tolypothrix sp. LEGE 11397]|uniref:hypothetical protein n=1 Tax=Tolypothrix sp. LEGE 11397 TaxID=2777971 RepID=UPI000694159F|nr:hypothetical protein [Tolypothrix sp. LEGE 11397]MBE9084843.1 hypothetical protein [Tolypothrix sp. LEGE 11397]UYD27717.1 hypothetical protein HGR01_06525 [Tolypothrix sp. PCC 7712]UYD36420.1 hypothetical protein HG267_12155 [Tolypothrix sp. PCC 7601]BAY93939.1 hypothetical protein NIES3275_59830 [Microchaete diplosiphon NIES-3275]
MLRGKVLSILLLKRLPSISLGLGKTLVTGILLTTAISTHPAAAEDKLLADNTSSEFSPAETTSEDSSAFESVIQQDIDWRQVTIEDSSPTVEFSSSQSLQASSASSNIIAKSNADLRAKDLRSQKTETAFNHKKPTQIAQTDSSGVVGDTLGEANRLRQELLVEPLVEIPRARLGGAPASSAGTPTAYGASWGQAFIGGGIYIPLDQGKTDGSLALGFGLGDAVKSVGLEVDLNIISVGGQNTNFGDFGESGGIGFKLHKYFADGTAVAVGWSNPISWGDANQAKDTIYGVVTKAFYLQPNNLNNQMPLTVSLGLGSGDFRSLGAYKNLRDNPPNVFGSVGLRVIPQASLVGSWTGNALNMGASFAPFPNSPLVINTIFTDLTGSFSNGLGFSLTAGYSLQF